MSRGRAYFFEEVVEEVEGDNAEEMDADYYHQGEGHLSFEGRGERCLVRCRSAGFFRSLLL